MSTLSIFFFYNEYSHCSYMCLYLSVLAALVLSAVKQKYIKVKITNQKINAEGQNTEQQITNLLPDRLDNPDQYSPLLPVESELAHHQDSTESGDDERCITPAYTYGSVN